MTEKRMLILMKVKGLYNFIEDYKQDLSKDDISDMFLEFMHIAKGVIQAEDMTEIENRFINEMRIKNAED